MLRARLTDFAGWRSLATPAGLLLGANLLLAAATGAAAVAVWRAVHVEAIPAAAPPAPASPGTGPTLPLRTPAAPDSDALDNDPFSADRLLPESGDAPADDPVAVAADAPLPIAPEAVRLIGTVVLPGTRSFAVYQLPSEVPKTVRIGERVGNLRLEAVMPGSAVFRAAGGARIEIHLIKPGS